MNARMTISLSSASDCTSDSSSGRSISMTSPSSRAVKRARERRPESALTSPVNWPGSSTRITRARSPSPWAATVRPRTTPNTRGWRSASASTSFAAIVRRRPRRATRSSWPAVSVGNTCSGGAPLVNARPSGTAAGRSGGGTGVDIVLPSLPVGNRMRHPAIVVLPASVCPLFRLPSATQGAVEVDHRHQLVAPRLGQRDLGGKELLLRLQHLEIRGQPRVVAHVGQAHGLAVGGHLARPLAFGLDQLRPIDQRPRHLAEGVGGGGLVGDAGLLPARPGRLVAALDAAAVEERPHQARPHAPRLALPLEEAAQL